MDLTVPDGRHWPQGGRRPAVTGRRYVPPRWNFSSAITPSNGCGQAGDPAEVAEVLTDPDGRRPSADDPSRTVVMGWTPAGRQLFIVVARAVLCSSSVALMRCARARSFSAAISGTAMARISNSS